VEAGFNSIFTLEYFFLSF